MHLLTLRKGQKGSQYGPEILEERLGVEALRRELRAAARIAYCRSHLPPSEDSPLSYSSLREDDS